MNLDETGVMILPSPQRSWTCMVNHPNIDIAGLCFLPLFQDHSQPYLVSWCCAGSCRTKSAIGWVVRFFFGWVVRFSFSKKKTRTNRPSPSMRSHSRRLSCGIRMTLGASRQCQSPGASREARSPPASERCEQNTFSHCTYRRRHFVSTSHMMLHADAWLKLNCVPKHFIITSLISRHVSRPAQ